MSDLTQCFSCNGRKQLTGLGGMMTDCPACKGVGFVDKSIFKEEYACISTSGSADSVPVIRDSVIAKEITKKIAEKYRRKIRKLKRREAELVRAIPLSESVTRIADNGQESGLQVIADL